ncbi:MAG: class E sortase [Gaiellaceae bacterium]
MSAEHAANENDADENEPQARRRTSSSKEAAAGAPGSRKRRFVGRIGLVVASLGVVLIAWALVILFFGDPVTALYQDWRQHQMAGQLSKEFRQFKPPIPLSSNKKGEPSPAAVRAAARRFSQQANAGQPIGRIEISRIGISKVVVNGTDWGADLSRGPGRYPQSSWPGMGKVTAIAGHRTTFGAPFRHIDELARGDQIRLLMPYGTFTYRVFKHEVVPSNDWSILRKRGFDTLVLSACHPLYSASHRWIVFARLASVTAPAR